MKKIAKDNSFSRQTFEIEPKKITAILEVPNKNTSSIMLTSTLTIYNKVNDGVPMTDYQYTIFWSKVKRRIKTKFIEYFKKDLKNIIIEYPEQSINKGKMKYITVTILFDNEIEDWKTKYDKEVEAFLYEAYDVVTNYKYYL